MGSWRGSEQTIGQNFKMKLLLALCMLGLATASQDYKMFMKWAKTKAMESCWGEDNMKVYTVNMKKAVAKCEQSDAPELDLPPFRAAHRFVNNLVSMAGDREEEKDEMESFIKFFKFSKMIEMMNDEKDDSDYMSYHKSVRPMKYSNEYSSKDSSNMNMMEKMMMRMRNMMDNESKNNRQNMDHYNEYKQGYEGYKSSDDYSKFMKSQDHDQTSSLEKMLRTMSQMRFKRDADDSLALNDRLKEKLVGMMEEHVNKVSNMTCVLKELNVIDHNNNIDVNAIKKDSEQYKMPSQWFEDKYEGILDSCYQVAENLPASLQEEYVPNNYNGPMRNLGKIKSFMNCCKSAKMKLCMYQDTKKKIEANFGPLDELLEGFNNQLTEERVFFMVNELLQGSEDEFL